MRSAASYIGDHQWIHVDVDRAKRAHGFLTLSLIPVLSSSIYTVTDAQRGLNYGLNKVRFTGAVPVGKRVRLRLALNAVEKRPDGALLLTLGCGVDVEGKQGRRASPRCSASFTRREAQMSPNERANSITTAPQVMGPAEAPLKRRPLLLSATHCSAAVSTHQLARAQQMTNAVSRDLDISFCLARRREPAAPLTILTPDALKLAMPPIADCARYDSLRRSA